MVVLHFFMNCKGESPVFSFTLVIRVGELIPMWLAKSSTDFIDGLFCITLYKDYSLSNNCFLVDKSVMVFCLL